MGIKFKMEADALGVLGQKSQGQSEDLGQLVRNLVDAAEPLEGTFNGTAKQRFNDFKARTDDVAAKLNAALIGITHSIAGQNRAFVTAADEGAAQHESAAAVKAALSVYEADGVSENYARLEADWNSAGQAVREIITSIRNSPGINDDIARQALSQAANAIPG